MVKNTLKTVLLLVLAWLWLPTGDPSDFIITAAIINAIGMQLYLALSAVLIYYLYRTIEGKTIKQKFHNIKKEIRRLVR